MDTSGGTRARSGSSARGSGAHGRTSSRHAEPGVKRAGSAGKSTFAFGSSVPRKGASASSGSTRRRRTLQGSRSASNLRPGSTTSSSRRTRDGDEPSSPTGATSATRGDVSSRDSSRRRKKHSATSLFGASAAAKEAARAEDATRGVLPPVRGKSKKVQRRHSTISFSTRASVMMTASKRRAGKGSGGTSSSSSSTGSSRSGSSKSGVRRRAQTDAAGLELELNDDTAAERGEEEEEVEVEEDEAEVVARAPRRSSKRMLHSKRRGDAPRSSSRSSSRSGANTPDPLSITPTAAAPGGSEGAHKRQGSDLAAVRVVSRVRPRRIAADVVDRTAQRAISLAYSPDDEVYLRAKDVRELVESMFFAVVQERPADVSGYMQDFLRARQAHTADEPVDLPKPRSVWTSEGAAAQSVEDEGEGGAEDTAPTDVMPPAITSTTTTTTTTTTTGDDEDDVDVDADADEDRDDTDMDSTAKGASLPTASSLAAVSSSSSSSSASSARKLRGNRSATTSASSLSSSRSSQETVVSERSDDGETMLELAVRQSLLNALLNAPECTKVCARMTPVVFDHGDLLCRQGEIERNFFVLVRGCVDVSLQENDGTVYKLGAGETFGLLSMVYGTPRCATVRSQGASTTWMISWETLTAVVGEDVVATWPRKLHTALMRTGAMQHVGRYEQLTMVRSLRNAQHQLETLHELERVRSERKEVLEAKLKAEQLAQAKGDFLAHMSHELRTPLTGVIGMTDLLLDTKLTALQRDYVQMMRMSGDALLANINNVLDLSKIEAQKVDLEMIRMNVLELVEGCAELIVIRILDKKVEVLSHVDHNVPTVVWADMNRVRQILFNLLGNAVKFTEQGYIMTSVHVTQRNEREVELHFSVEDTGPGISKERMERLFNAYQQADKSVARTHGGTGLGLVISRELSELMGGRMWVESTEGLGTTFHFTIVAEVASATKVDESTSVAVAPPELKGKTVLVVDDNAMVLYVMKQIMRPWGVRTGSAASARKALDLLGRKSYDVVIASSELPDMCEKDFTNAVLNNNPGQELIVLASLRTVAATSGNIPRVAKPLRQSRLLSQLCRSCKVDTAATPRSTGSTPRDDEQAPTAHVLVCEDDPTSQKVVSRMLSTAGYTFECVDDGLAGVLRAAQEKFDIILMDRNMPRMGGLEATKRIRSEKGPNQHTVIIALTADAFSASQRECLNAGCTDFLPKPLRKKPLYSMVSKWLGREHEADTSGDGASGAEEAGSKGTLAGGGGGGGKVVRKRRNSKEKRGEKKGKGDKKRRSPRVGRMSPSSSMERMPTMASEVRA